MGEVIIEKKDIGTFLPEEGKDKKSKRFLGSVQVRK